MTAPNLSLKERFFIHVRKSSTCWIWTGAKNSDGYGQLRVLGRNLLAHRVSYKLFKGPIPKGFWVCHTCDNPPCVRPSHLWLGTPEEDMVDASSKGRMIGAKGESSPRAKLNWSQVREIQRRYQKGTPNHKEPNSGTSLAKEFGVCHTTIYRIINGSRWNQRVSSRFFAGRRSTPVTTPRRISEDDSRFSESNPKEVD